MEIARLLDSVQSMLPSQPSPTSIVPPSGADFVHSTSSVVQDITPEERAFLESFARKNPSRSAKTGKRFLDAPDSDTEELLDGNEIIRLPRITNAAQFLAFDGTHVLVDNTPKMLWVPYMFLRYDCPSLKNKKQLEEKLLQLRTAPVPSGQASRIAINELRQVQFVQYYPREERVMYTMLSAKGKKQVSYRGLTPISQLADTAALREFVSAQKELIESMGKGNRSNVVQQLGLRLRHDDMTPQLDPDEEYAFLFGGKEAQPPRKRVRAAQKPRDEVEAASILVMLSRDFAAAGLPSRDVAAVGS
jgi:hypothetical protein